jgi:hypothetical protein
MTEFKYGSNNYRKKLSTANKASSINATAADENSRKPLSRLKKSFSECESYEMEGVNLNLSPSRRKCSRAEELHRYHHCPRQMTISDNGIAGEISFIDVNKTQYNYDPAKPQYLLQQQQKLKEYKIDPNYPTTNGDNYSSESSTETRGILKKASSTTTTSESNASNNNNININSSSNNNKGSLKRNKGLSTLSLCSCDADTEVSQLELEKWKNIYKHKQE